MLHFCKYHGLGNDYLVVSPEALKHPLTEAEIRLACHRNYGLGSDGILVGPYLPGSPEFDLLGALAGISEQDNASSLAAVRIFNPEGSEAEKSGNGTRIFSRYLFDCGLVEQESPFSLTTLGGQVRAVVFSPDKIQVEMGRVTFRSGEIPVTGEDREVLLEKYSARGREFTYCCANIGNPHCIVLCPKGISAELAKEFGPGLETDARFPRRINVQFMQVIDKHAVAIEIWERGAGYTLASGSSASCCAAVAVRLGLCESPVEVRMPGGTLQVTVASDYQLTQCGPVEFVYDADYAAL